MPEPSDPFSLLRQMRPVLWVAIGVAALWSGWVLYSRWDSEREFQRQQEAKQAAEAAKMREIYGNGQVKIMNLSLSTANIKRGETAQLCYGVVNAKTVKFDPEVKDVWPSQSRCVEISPKQDTKYKLTATDASGHSESAELTVFVH